MKFDNIETCDNEQVNSNSQETSPNQLRSLWKCFEKRKLMWMIILIVVVILIIIIPIIIIKTKKLNVTHISTITTTEITTQETTETMNKITTEEEILPKYNKYNQQGITVAGGNGQGVELNQISSPGNIIIDENKTILICEETNHRIVQWKYGSNYSQIIAGGNGKGNGNDQLSHPTDMVVDKENNALFIFEASNTRIVRWFRENQTKQQILRFDFSPIHLAIDKDGSLYISDDRQNEVRRWKDGDTTRGTIVAGGHGSGDEPNQFRSPNCIFVDDEYSLYVSDWGNYRVMKWKKDATEGIVVAGWNGLGNNPDQLSFPRGVIVDHLGHIYVADSGNHRVMRWREGDIYGSVVVGGNDAGSKSNELNGPTRLSFDDEENLYVLDQNNRRVQKFQNIF